ncbi:formate dehydrogenase [Azospirillum sp. ST 5-10]|uniref:formate dehydrogenase n=1 Tax=unclassified Azospirillum TaxID=2630922 RepID=UPI003F49F293
MTDHKDNSTLRRRDLFRAAGLGAGAFGAAAVGLSAGAPEAEAGTAPEGTGYRETEHVRKAYETSRF